MPQIEKSTLPEEPRERAQALAHIHMQRLADMLFPSMRGVYNSEYMGEKEDGELKL